MADITLDLSGKAGLAPLFAGDRNQISEKPHLRLAGEGQMVSGYFNPLLVDGYMAPVPTTTTDLTASPAISNVIGSAVYDNREKDYYVAERGNVIYKGDELSDEALASFVTLPATSVVQDLEIYSINGDDALFYVYNGETFSPQENITSDVGIYEWAAGTIRIDPSGSDPVTLYSKDTFRSPGSAAHDVVVPSGYGDLTVLVVIRSEGDAIPDFNSVAMTSVFDQDFNLADVSYNLSAYYTNSVSAGTYTLDVNNTEDCSVFVAVLGNTATVPVTVTDFSQNVNKTAKTDIATNDGSLYLTTYTVNEPTLYNSYASEQTYSTATQVDDNGGSMYINDAGTKMYVMGDTAAGGANHIWEYDLSSAFNLTTATYSGNSLNIDTQVPDPFFSYFTMKPDGTKIYAKIEGTSNVYEYTMTTAFDLSTASFTATHDISISGFSNYRGVGFNSTGTKMYTVGNPGASYLDSRVFILQYDLSTAWDLTTATYVDMYDLNSGSSLWVSIGVINNDNTLYVHRYRGEIMYLMFDSESPGNLSGIDPALNVTFTPTLTDSLECVYISPTGQYVFSRDTNTDNVTRVTRADKPEVRIGSRQPTAGAVNNGLEYDKFSIIEDIRPVQVGVTGLGLNTYSETDWLTNKQSVYLSSSHDYNFIRLADNGFAYLFCGNKVHKIDGTTLGGENGLITRNVLLFPERFTITDAFDYRSSMYIAVNKERFSSSAIERGNYSGSCFVYVWDRNSVEPRTQSVVEITGVRRIVKIYPGEDAHIRLLVITDDGQTELRRFGYNDSGSATFTEKQVLGLGAHPTYPDGLTIAGDKAVWLGNNGTIYGEKDMAVYQLGQVESKASLPQETITSGAVLFGSGIETATGTDRTDKQGLLMFYEGASIEAKKIYLFDLTDDDNGALTPQAGSVYSGITYLPPSSIVRRVRVYNAPIANSDDTVIATVKLYFNQSTDPTMPNGMTKSITKKEAKRGYVDFNISKEYVHAIQLEFEWATAVPIGEDMYLPSVAIISTEDTEVKTPDSD